MLSKARIYRSTSVLVRTMFLRGISNDEWKCVVFVFLFGLLRCPG